MNDFQHEWITLHGNIEKYEQFSLVIKLCSVLVCVLTQIFSVNPVIAIFLVLILWGQDSIWKTFQSRLENRILIIESNIKSPNQTEQAFQLYSHWQQNRPSFVQLIKEYIFNALKPTIAYPYLILISANLFKI